MDRNDTIRMITKVEEISTKVHVIWRDDGAVSTEM